ncbi:hypothetical protein Dsin_016172 [Dipteronia sinensis]|uniref:Uncharacterized protein n=1 Tax=Dipteronia sinensis TaxID=43782 RepID=A0AAE0ACK7_9ROSI|nr:hypothetical protein Dsin_016172 [Dipteronia sinensis]
MARSIRSARGRRSLVSSQFHGVPSHNSSPIIQSRVAKSAEEDDILTILDSKMSRLHSPEELPVETFDSFKVEYELQNNVVVLNKRFGNSELIRIEYDNRQLIVDVSKEDGGSDALRFTHRWWRDDNPDEPLQFELTYQLSHDSSYNRHDKIKCDGKFTEFLNARGVNRKLRTYLDQYWERTRKLVEDIEQYKCLQMVRSFIEKN